MAGKGKRAAVSAPMSQDSHMGALRAIYTVEKAAGYINGATGCTFQPRFLWSIHDNHPMRIFASGMEEMHVIYGGEELLERGLKKLIQVAHPELIVIQNTCIPALIGEDCEGIARMVSEKTGVKILSTTNPNYKGTQLDGFQNVVNRYVTDLMERPQEIRKGSVNLLGVLPGEHNWRNDLKEFHRILQALGLTVHCTLVGDKTSVREILEAPQAEVNCLVYPEAGLSTARLMEERFGTPYLETQFPPIGIDSSREWILKIAEFFGRRERAESFLEGEMEAMGRALSRLEEGQIFNLQFLFGKTYALEAMPFVIPAVVKFLREDLNMSPTTLAFQEYHEVSHARLARVLRENELSPEIQTDGDHKAFLESVKGEYARDGRYPDSRPSLVIGSTLDSLIFAFEGIRLPVLKLSYPVLDEAIITDNPFVGLRGVVTLVERVHNLIHQKYWYTGQAFGNHPDPYAVAKSLTARSRMAAKAQATPG